MKKRMISAKKGAGVRASKGSLLAEGYEAGEGEGGDAR